MVSTPTTPSARKGDSVQQRYIVTGALIAAYDKDSKIEYLYRGSIVPSDVPAAELERLMAEHLIAKSDTAGHVHVSDIAGLTPAFDKTQD